MSDIEVELQNFIKNTILTLACCNNIDHRNYDHKKQFYRLKELSTNNSIDNSIIIIIKEILEKQILKNKDEDCDEDSDEDSDDEDEKIHSIFINFINYVGLYEIYNLHGDSGDIFFFDFMKIIKKYNF